MPEPLWKQEPWRDLGTNLSNHRGVMLISDVVLREIAPEVSIDGCDTFGRLRDQGIFARLRERLLLPESYTIRGIFAQHFGQEWGVLIESPDLPDVSSFSWEAIEYPRIEPTYGRSVTGETRLVELVVRAQRTVPIEGGLDWLLAATMSHVQEDRGMDIKRKGSSDEHEAPEPPARP